eukprot:366510-Chlamydomonas_euryale.AAC.33
MRKKGVGPVKTQSRRAKTRQDAPQTGGQFPECMCVASLAAQLPSAEWTRQGHAAHTSKTTRCRKSSVPTDVPYH